MELGFSLHVGMDSGEDAVLFGYHLSSGIRIENTINYHIKIIKKIILKKR